ncbi:MAG: hypothetical protein RL261_858 [Pseudomonadota bacterium]|jgi:hypothetical protein
MHEARLESEFCLRPFFSSIGPFGRGTFRHGGLEQMTKAATNSQVMLARVVVGLMIAFVVGGLLWYGFSAGERARLWQNLFDRPGGPMLFRFFLQPTMAAIAAWRDGVSDARAGRTPFFAGAVRDPAQRMVRLNEALVATARIILLGLVMDGIYQAIEFKSFHPVEAVIIALVLAFLPYLLLRGLIARAARRWPSLAKGFRR